jgi:hypothetical protein
VHLNIYVRRRITFFIALTWQDWLAGRGWDSAGTSPVGVGLVVVPTKQPCRIHGAGGHFAARRTQARPIERCGKYRGE